MIITSNYAQCEDSQILDPSVILAGCSNLDLKEAFEIPPPPLDFVVAGLKSGTVAILASPGGMGKSFLALEIAMGIAAPGADKDLLDLGITSHGPVLMLNAEDPLDVLRERVFNIGRFLEPEIHAAVQAGLTIKSMRGAQPNLLNPGWVDAITKAAEGKRLVVIDTFSRFHSGDENSNQDMADVIGSCERITERSGTCLMALHHTSKSAAVNGLQSSQQSTRGASAIVDNARWQSYLEGLSEKEAGNLGIEKHLRHHFVSFGISKQNYGRPIAPKWLVKLGGGVLHAVAPGYEMAEACLIIQDIIHREFDEKALLQAANGPLLGVAA